MRLVQGNPLHTHQVNMTRWSQSFLHVNIARGMSIGYKSKAPANEPINSYACPSLWSSAQGSLLRIISPARRARMRSVVRPTGISQWHPLRGGRVSTRKKQQNDRAQWNPQLNFAGSEKGPQQVPRSSRQMGLHLGEWNASMVLLDTALPRQRDTFGHMRPERQPGDRRHRRCGGAGARLT